MEGLMLIVDDVEVNREILRVHFETKYDILMAENGEQALRMLESCQGNIDIVLLDLQMPGESGMTLLEKRRELDYFKNVPVVVITGSDSKEDQIAAFQLGANDYIPKPFVPEIVVSRVANVMASSRRLLSVELEAQQLKVKSETDEMTGLLNKSTTEIIIQDRLKKSSGHLDALVVIDIDHFKLVNDSSGHQTGDHVIQIVANLISSRFRKTDYVGRIGGDEFCVLMVDVPSVEIVREKVNELVQIMRYKPNLTIPEYVTLSIGFATNERCNTSYTELFKKADEALLEAKVSGRAQYREYGIEQMVLNDDIRPAVLLLSNNRSICSAVRALLPMQIRVIEVLHLDALESLSDNEKQRVAFIYVDVSDCEKDGSAYWEQLNRYEWMNHVPTLAICQEGRVDQYKVALENDVVDLFTAPLETESFKRRTARQLQDFGMVKEESCH